MTRALVALGLGLGLAACTSFADPDIVVDLRVIAMSSTIPEQIVDVDLANPQQPADLLQQLVPARMCALAADPGEERRLHWQLTLCVYGTANRCDPDVLSPLASGVIDDPDTTVPAPEMCATIAPNGNLLGVLLATLQEDAFRGLGGIDYLVQLQVGGEGDDPVDDLYASKTLRVAPRIPAERQPNQNPALDRLEASLKGDDPTTLPWGRCVEQPAPLEVAPGTRLRLTPIERADARESYVVPTIDGRSQMFTESLTYQWVASAGGFSSGSTGGTRDVSGNLPELFTEWRAPAAKDVLEPTLVQLWVVQRDERYGATWYQSCVRVVP